MKTNNRKVVFMIAATALALPASVQQIMAANTPGAAVVQQSSEITGTVTDGTEPIIGASVKVKGKSMGVITDIDGNTLKVSFLSNNKLDKKELEDFYFMRKVARAIKAFSKKLGLDYKIYLNGIEWNEIMKDQ